MGGFELWAGGHTDVMRDGFSLAASGPPTGLDLEVAALAERVAAGMHPEYTGDVLELRRAVQLCSVGLGELSVRPAGVEAPAAQLIAALGLEDFVDRRIRGWARLN
jgi:hypothetical protein